MVQQCVGRFQLFKQTLGIGAYGKVITARDTASGQLVAAKVIATEDKRQEQLVLQEVTLMQVLEHPNIIALRGFEAIGRECYIFMELASHGELFGRVLQQGNLTEKEGTFFFGQIVSAVQFMHDQGIIHRDLKLVRHASARLLGCGSRVQLTACWRHLRTLTLGTLAGKCAARPQ
jgi:serine/threonine protein kinase